VFDCSTTKVSNEEGGDAFCHGVRPAISQLSSSVESTSVPTPLNHLGQTLASLGQIGPG